ncbi:MAG: hypothetical protein EB141_13095 [Verrucomicrobia bacterium]|nr:hypothetical protein [Verrucomicrobiota bacterium]NBU08048.1 hypothetical protein [Pseudomonadota bacterium]NDA67791.1 hypothetical protein [Verrucomicrobiota bacterium]NDB76556.1 hypothetical protein [Verrucomicrobiota bacterium]NDD39607.1 hypothetical protein [Verrucomicrobiota bacterium]
MRLGLDFDGTVVVYDEVFHRYATERFGLPAGVPLNKTVVRDWLRSQTDGEQKWIELQGLVYGLKMTEAKMAPGLAEFLRAIRAVQIPVCIISHKTEFSVAEPHVNLRAAALAWLEANGFFAAEGFCLRREDVFFESTRAAKLQRIAAQGCTVFVDDLEEVLTEPEFPQGVERWHYLPGQTERREGDIQAFSDWTRLLARLCPNEPIFATVAATLGQRPDSVTRLAGGANNVVARVDVGGKPLLAKLYFTHARDPRDRLGTEFGMLDFLWRNGVRCVPEPLQMSREQNLGLYEFVAGLRVASGQVTQADVGQLVDLLAAMWRLRTQPGAEKLPPASEAAFTLDGYWANVERRLQRVRTALANRAEVATVSEFVERELVPVTAEVRAFVECEATSLSLALDAELPHDQRTLSPADHGFHNVLRRADGRLTFLDFEYAGWDDPAQTIANAMLLPEVPLPIEHRADFIRDMLARLNDATGVAARLRLTYPMLALKWSLIMLNEFLPVAGARRMFAGANEVARRAAQLEKSRRQLGVVRESLRADCWLAAWTGN